MPSSYGVQRCLDTFAFAPTGKGEKPVDLKRQILVDIQALWQVPRGQVRCTNYLTLLRLQQSEQYACKASFAGSVRPDQGDDFPPFNGQIDAVQNPACAEAEHNFAGVYER